eukprot:TRINITY_DN6035_c0_g1_i1.p1 TRINITY_DN6035_c0_g1~~TRINITY_DN6035_c0_g1_i1.p1  ORF type:complete len:63 (+),score=7.06 TRINITY_DN6035_c0_g1_i1:64-252(+)
MLQENQIDDFFNNVNITSEDEKKIRSYIRDCGFFFASLAELNDEYFVKKVAVRHATILDQPL